MMDRHAPCMASLAQRPLTAASPCCRRRPSHLVGLTAAAAAAAREATKLTSVSLLLRMPLTRSVRFLSNIRSKFPLTFLSAMVTGDSTHSTPTYHTALCQHGRGLTAAAAAAAASCCCCHWRRRRRWRRRPGEWGGARGVGGQSCDLLLRDVLSCIANQIFGELSSKYTRLIPKLHSVGDGFCGLSKL